MIPRTLIPRDLPPPPPGPREKPRRTSSWLDARTVVPSDLPAKPLDGTSAIPAHVPLDVLARRTIIPRDLPVEPLPEEQLRPPYAPLTILDERMVVPPGLPAAPFEPTARPAEPLGDVVEPDVLTTGSVHFAAERPAAERPRGDWLARTGSILFHALLILFLLFEPKLFPYHPPTAAEVAQAERQLGFVYLPRYVNKIPKISPPANEKPSNRIRISPDVLREVAPPEPATPPPGRMGTSEPAIRPEQPSPRQPAAPPAQPQPRAKPEPSDIQPVTPAHPSPGLLLPRLSPEKELEQAMRGASREQNPSVGFAGPIPPTRPGGVPAEPGENGGGGLGTSGGRGYLGGSVQLLTPTEGVDFTNYFARMLAAVRRNWYALIPESARLGDRGRVVIQFHIMKNGAVPYPEPYLISSSGKEPLDRAAMAAISASNPFDQLPPAFTGPYIEVRFIFLYNLPLNSR
jgi:TonB family protein